MKTYKICCITYSKLQILTQKVIRQNNDSSLEISFINGLLEETVDKIIEKEKNGIEVFTVGGANSIFLKKMTSANFITIDVSPIDYLLAISKAMNYGDKIALVFYYAEPKVDISNFEKLTGKNIIIITYKTKEDLKGTLKKIKIDALIGRSMECETGEELNIPSILIYDEKKIIQAIYKARDLAIELRKQRAESEYIRAMMRNIPNGIIYINNKGIITSFNKTAENIFNLRASKIKGQSVKLFLPECNIDDLLNFPNIIREKKIKITNKNQEIVIKGIPITVSDSLIGAVLIITNIYEKQETEIKTKNDYKNGFVAKSRFDTMFGSSKLFTDAVKKAKQFARTDSNIFIYGKTGVGKELFAQSIHNYSSRRDKPFVAVNCASIPENLLESELFGYDGGAFTGSRKEGKKGLFELADKGTMFLDEIGEIPKTIQTRLLRVLQEQEIMRVGGDRIIPVNVRIVSASNIDLENTEKTLFRQDLLYRLNVLRLDIPTLKERGDDIIDIFYSFFKKTLEIDNHNLKIPKAYLNILKLYSWPGNIRELRNICERFSLIITNRGRNDKYSIKHAIVESIGLERWFKDIIDTYPDINTKNISTEQLKKLIKIYPKSKDSLAHKLGISRTTLWRIDKNYD